MVIALIAANVKVSRRMSLILFGFGCVMIAITAKASPLFEIRFLVWGMPAAAIVAGATLHRFDLGGARWLPILLIGDASFALYLIHPFMSLPRLAAQRLFGTVSGIWSTNPIFYAVALVVVVLTTAIIIHVFVERPILIWLRRRRADSFPAIGSSAR